MNRDDITLPQGYELHELPPDYDGPIWIEGQLRQLAYAVCERDTALLRQCLEIFQELDGGCTDSGDGTVEAITVCCPEIIDALIARLEDEQ